MRSTSSSACWTTRLAALALALCATQCAVFAPGPAAFAFGVVGDAPYTPAEEGPFRRTIEHMNAERLAFVTHVGDILGGQKCTDAIYAERREMFDRSRHPFIYTPGDNEWTDCRDRGDDPIERLARLRELFFAGPESLGQERIVTEYQEGYPENRLWSVNGVRFATLNYPGHDNNVGHGARNDEEARKRSAANARWLGRLFDEGAREDTVAVVVITQANPWFAPNHEFDAFIAQLGDGGERLRKPVLFVHGDTHIYRVDSPFRDAAGMPLLGITRRETFGSPCVGWVRVDVDPGRPQPFSFTPHLTAVPPRSGRARAAAPRAWRRARPSPRT